MAEYYPNDQVNQMWNFLATADANYRPKTKEDLRRNMFHLTHTNKICIRCDNKKAEKYITCEKCGIYNYCSEECLEADKNKHVMECRNINLPADKLRHGAKFALINMKTNKVVDF